MKFLDFIHGRGGTVFLPGLASPPDEFTDVHAVFTALLAHERHISALIHDIYALAEQVEEEENVGEVIDRLILAGDSGQALLLIDQELGARGDED